MVKNKIKILNSLYGLKSTNPGEDHSNCEEKRAYENFEK